MLLSGTSMPPPASQPRVLLVDIGGESAKDCELLLQREGYEVQSVCEIDQVVEVVQCSPPDLILFCMDQLDESVLEVTSDLRVMDELKLISVVFMTNVPAEEHEVVQGLLCGADDYLVIPGRLMELRARIRVQLRHKRDRELLKWVREQRTRFRSAAMIDPVTGILNRRSADEVIVRALGSAHAEPLMLILADVDHFKRVNDTYGHRAGDEVLREVATTLSRLTRTGDFVARFGGEEFLVLIHNADPGLARVIAERFRGGVEALRLQSLPQLGFVTISLGVAAWDGSAPRPSPSTFLEAADIALYRAKAQGRNRVEVEWLPAPEGERPELPGPEGKKGRAA